MRKSREVHVTLLASLAMLVSGCRDVPESRNCVDAQGHIVPDSHCGSSVPGTQYHFIYGGSSGGHVGDTVYGGSATPSDGVSRGGFGGHGGDAGGE